VFISKDMKHFCAATSTKKRSLLRLGGRNTALFLLYQGIRVVATLDFENEVKMG